MISFIKSGKSINDFPKTEREVVFVGRSNAGKSSLLNALYKNNLAFVGKTPGKTRLINFFDINGEYTAVDVPGYGFANRSQNETIEFSNMMDEYFSRTNVRLAIIIVDSRLGLTKDDLDMKYYLESKNVKYIIAANKIDKLSNNKLYNNKQLFFKDYENVIYISAEKKTNIEELRKEILCNLS